MKEDSVATAKRGAGQKLLWSMMAATAALSLVLLTYAHLIYLPAMSTERGGHQFLRAGRHRSANTMDMNLRELYKTQAETFNEDQQKVVDMTRHAWQGYRKFAGWRDYLRMPILKGGSVYGHDMALTTVDSLDTLFVMGLHDEFDNASAWVKANLSETMFRPNTVSFFEITIRSLGGLLSAYYLSGERHFLDLADNLGKALQMGFTCGNYMPCRAIDLKVDARRPKFIVDTSLTSEMLSVTVYCYRIILVTTNRSCLKQGHSNLSLRTSPMPRKTTRSCFRSLTLTVL